MKNETCKMNNGERAVQRRFSRPVYGPRHPSSLIPHPSSLLLHPSSFILHPSLVPHRGHRPRRVEAGGSGRRWPWPRRPSRKRWRIISSRPACAGRTQVFCLEGPAAAELSRGGWDRRRFARRFSHWLSEWGRDATLRCLVTTMGVPLKIGRRSESESQAWRPPGVSGPGPRGTRPGGGRSR